MISILLLISVLSVVVFGAGVGLGRYLDRGTQARLEAQNKLLLNSIIAYKNTGMIQPIEDEDDEGDVWVMDDEYEVEVEAQRRKAQEKTAREHMEHLARYVVDS